MITSIILYKVFISYNNLLLNNYTITNNKINNEINIVIISDLHDNQFGKNNKKLLYEINKQSPDIILVVGDMVNEYSTNDKIVITLMKQLSKSAKVFYSLGNTEKDYILHDTSSLWNDLKESGVTVLNNEYEDIKVNNTIIRIGGMYDYAFRLKNDKYMSKHVTKNNIYNFLCKFEDTDNYKIMMAHRPDSFIFNDATKDWDVDLVVSGHTHGGQVVLPFVGGLYASEQGWFPKYDKGLFNFDDTNIIITSGLGSGKEILPRFNNTPEVVNLNLCE